MDMYVCPSDSVPLFKGGDGRDGGIGGIVETSRGGERRPVFLVYDYVPSIGDTLQSVDSTTPCGTTTTTTSDERRAAAPLARPSRSPLPAHAVHFRGVWAIARARMDVLGGITCAVRASRSPLPLWAASRAQTDESGRGGGRGCLHA